MKTVEELCRDAAEATVTDSVSSTTPLGLLIGVIFSRANRMREVIGPAIEERDAEIERLRTENAELRSQSNPSEIPNSSN